MIIKGKYKFKLECRFCQKNKLKLFLDLGWMPHAGNFLEYKEIGKEKYYPLRIFYCKSCHLVQVLDVPNGKDLFTNYKYASSYSLKNYFEKYAIKLNKLFKKNDFIVEIGCNDGVLLKPLKKMGCNILGVDPSGLINDKSVNFIKDYFNYKTAKYITKKYGKADYILASNVLAHIDNMNDVLKGVCHLLKYNGTLIFEVHYLPVLIEKKQFDFFYNEHLSYYSLTSLNIFFKKHNLKIYKVEKTKVHNGSIRVYVNRKSKITKSVINMLNYEKENGYLKTKKYIKFGKEIINLKQIILNKINKINRKEKLAGYGSSGRANTILNYCGIDSSKIEFIVDESPLRIGKFTPGSHIPIISLSDFKKKNEIKKVLLFASAYKKQIVAKNKNFIKHGGRFIKVI